MRTLSGILLYPVIFTLFISQGYTQNNSPADVQKKETPASITPGKFVDTNNNGVCDNFEARNTNLNKGGFVDKDGDGLCDNRQNVVPCKGNRDCCGKGKGNGYHYGKGNGQCCGAGPGNCCGKGHQYRHGSKAQKPVPVNSQPSENKKN